jgi:hypothetical protein
MCVSVAFELASNPFFVISTAVIITNLVCISVSRQLKALERKMVALERNTNDTGVNRD